MPFFRFEGDAQVRYGGLKVNKGDVIQASGMPGSKYVEVPDPNAQQEDSMPDPKVVTNTASEEKKPSRKKKRDTEEEMNNG
jgi:hypothetical protein